MWGGKSGSGCDEGVERARGVEGGGKEQSEKISGQEKQKEEQIGGERTGLTRGIHDHEVVDGIMLIKLSWR